MASKTVIEGSDVSASQLKELFNQIASGALNSSHMQALIEHHNPFAVMGMEKLFNPHTYFTTREGLWVSDQFNDRVLAKQPTTMPYRGLEGVTSHVLPREMTDQKIIDEMLGGMDEVCSHPFTLDQVAAKIDLQSYGEDGELLNNGYANIFYVLIGEVLFAVNVFWNSEERTWYVHVWRLGGNGRWNVGIQVFRNTTLAI